MEETDEEDKRGGGEAGAEGKNRREMRQVYEVTCYDDGVA